MFKIKKEDKEVRKGWMLGGLMVRPIEGLVVLTGVSFDKGPEPVAFDVNIGLDDFFETQYKKMKEQRIEVVPAGALNGVIKQ